MIKIIFCALNEEKNLKKFLTGVNHEMQNLQQNFEIIACLDGSTDKSYQILQSFAKFYPIKILPLKNQRALGFAYKRLFLDVIENCHDDDLVISLDADNTHKPQQIAPMLQHFKKNKLDILIASRFCDKSLLEKFPLYRQFISKFTSILLQNLFSVKLISGTKLQDFTSGYRIYKVEKLKKLFALEKNKFISEPEFTYTCELLIKLAQLDCRIDEIAISYDYGQKIGASKLRVARNFYRLIILLLTLFFKKISTY
ncbi:MAG: glycosyltransferase family 2 protein [Rickettsiales bacterium]|nr:glycosyltransferase family 2 protein [Rickettsiales bacterium]